ncbi:MAG: DUF3006 domain-containing protein [Bacillota bacterium]|nr:DUF3006 domain-containing protein [Bacillota bacterium]MDI7249177.1 DUF3006 domain-containing protein [Bacillota bacterium]
MLIVDRFEGEWAVLEWEGRTFPVPRNLLPEGVREGDCLRWNLEVDRGATSARRRRVKALLEQLEE